jgi:hypothetical protein
MDMMVAMLAAQKEKVKELENSEFVSPHNREALSTALEVGKAVAHRGHAAINVEVLDVVG